MAKVNMSFNLDDTEDKYYFRQALSAPDYSSVIHELDNFLRAKLKYENLKEDEYAAYEATRSKLFELSREYSLPEGK